MKKSNIKSRVNFAAAAVFYTINAITMIWLAFSMQMSIDAAIDSDTTGLVRGIAHMVLSGLAGLISQLLAAKFRIVSVQEVLINIKAHRLNFLFRKKTPLTQDDNKELSFFTTDTDILENSFYSPRIRLFLYVP